MVLVSNPTTAIALSSGADGNSASVARRWKPPKTSPCSPMAAKAVTDSVRTRIDTNRRIATRRFSAPPPVWAPAGTSAALMRDTASRVGDNGPDAPRPRRRVHDGRPGDRRGALRAAADPDRGRPVAPGAGRAAAGQGRGGEAPAAPQPRRTDRRDPPGDRGAVRRHRRRPGL